MIEKNALLVDAVCLNKAESVAELLALGAQADGILDRDELTPLQFGVIYEAIDSIAVLLVCGANPFKKNRAGESAFEKAVERNHIIIVEVFFQAMCG